MAWLFMAADCVLSCDKCGCHLNDDCEGDFLFANKEAALTFGAMHGWTETFSGDQRCPACYEKYEDTEPKISD